MNSLKTKNNTVYFPERLTHHTVAELCQEIDFICQQCQSKQIYFDAQNFKFIDAFSMTVLFNEIAYVKSLNVKTYIRNHLNEKGELKAPIQYMDDSEFFLLMSGRKLNSDSTCRTTSLPIKRLAPQETIAWIHFEAMPWLARKLNVQPDDLIEIRICIEELLNNIRDHSDVEFSSIFIQHYPHPRLPKKHNQFKICISDNGFGLINRIQRSHPNFSNEQAIEFALKEGGTTKSSPRNAGMGLFTLTRTVCNNGGTFMLRTGKMHSLITSDEQQQHKIHYLNSTLLKGTAFEITLYADRLDLQQADTETFSWD